MSSSRVIAIITALGGSKGLHRKNIRPLGGVPLIGWTIRAALEAQCIDRVIVSTDDHEIAAISRDLGAEVPFMRPAELSTDTATSTDVVLHALESVPGYKQAVLLQPTSPFRTAEDIDEGYNVWTKNPNSGGCVSVREVTESPWLMFTSDHLGRMNRLLPAPSSGERRQDLPNAFILNGAFYFIDVARFLNEKKFVFDDSVCFEMPIYKSGDIDSLNDFEQAEKLISEYQKQL